MCINMRDKTISLYGLKEQFLKEKLPFNFAISNSSTSFYVENTENKQYVTPILKITETNIENGEIPNIICISAAGATGKSELCKYLSVHYSAPIFDLSKHAAVGSNSLTGVLFDSLGYDNAPLLINNLRSGTSFLIIDAVDEGFLKTTTNGYDSFLDNIISIGKTSPNTCFIILGRTQAVEHSYLYLDDKGIKVALLTIEAFTIEQAKEFINKRLGRQNFEQQYILVRDYIIETIEGFFKNQSEIKKAQYLSFIGYAPVLLSISSLLSHENNYKKPHEDLLARNDKNIDLIIAIVELILYRDKREKIDKTLLSPLLEDRSETFRQHAYNTVYDIDEQCFRILAYVLGKKINLQITGDKTFDSLYEDKISGWIKEHPFIENKKIQNAVFESYIVAKLVQSQNVDYKKLAYEYLSTRYKDAFMLFFIYDKLTKTNRIIDIKMLPFLYASIKSLDNSEHSTSLSIEEISISDSTIECDIQFNTNDKLFTYKSQISETEILFIGDYLSNIDINAEDAKFLLNKNRCIMIPPISIICKTLLSYPNEIIIDDSSYQNKDNIILEYENLDIDYLKTGTYALINRNRNSQCLKIFTDNRPEYPFDAYWESKVLSEFSDVQLKLYKKLRKIIALFKSHSKGRMAKFKDKINNRRVCGTGIGLLLLNELLEKKVIYLEGDFYFISPEKMDVYLGLSYDQIRMGIINDKTKQFLINLSLRHPDIKN